MKIAKILALAASLSLAASVVFAGSQNTSEEPGSWNIESENMTAHHFDQHHYSSPAEEAQDALLITEVKSAIAKADIGPLYALTVDADHGTVSLTGEAADRATAERIKDIASQVEGVKAVRNQIDWPSKRASISSNPWP